MKAQSAMPAHAHGREQFPVLIVDDDRSMRDTLAICLHEEGFAVSSVDTGESAIRLLRKTPRRWVVISDHHLGSGMNGAELGHILADELPQHGFLMLSGDGGQSGQSYAFVEKPFSLSKLLALLDVLMLLMANAPAATAMHAVAASP